MVYAVPRFLPRYLMVMLLAAALPSQPARGAGLPAVVELAQPENEALTAASFEILKEAYRRLGIAAEQIKLPGERAIQMVNSGQYFGDVMHAEGLELTYPNLVRVPVPLLDIEAVVFTYGRELAVADWAGLKPYRVCIRRGIKTVERATVGMDNVLGVNQYAFIFNMLKLGRCDVAVLPRSAWLEAQRLQFKGLRSQETPLQTWPSYHYLHKSHAELVPALAEQLQKMHQSGYLARSAADFTQRLDAASREGQVP
ncbi:ABC transporter substrate-binding protein [Rugamonas sp.]|uniref:substrate-binding periplasmic protein n=1 Tax=Rugamonas sp. TaxID=1926287 RepID=UPI0025DFC14D|nr:transporter substrate-binding domain-containing protein [Rugamonas sp.]